MPPVSRQQQKYMYAAAGRGEAWAKKWIREGKTKVRRKKVRRRA